MVAQNRTNRKLKVGSVDVRAALYSDTTATLETASPVGRLSGVAGKHTGDDVTYEAENSDDIDGGLGSEQYEVGASEWSDIDLEMLHLLTGHAGLYTVVAGTALNVTGETVVLNGTTVTPLKNKTQASTPTLVTSISVTDADDTAYTLDTDYRVALNTNGQTCIQRIATGGIDDGESVKVAYTYVPAASKTLSFGGGSIPVPLHLWLVNTQANGKRFITEVYKCTSMRSVEITYGSDKAKTLINMPVTLIGKPDSSRPAGDQLYKITDEVTVVSQA